MIRKAKKFNMVKLILGMVAAGVIFLGGMSGSEVRGAAKFDGVYVIVSQRSGLALDIWRGSPNNEANIIQWYRHNGSNQQWLIRPSIYEEGYYTITSVQNAGKSFDVYRGSKAIATRIIQYDSLPWQNNQKWRIMEHSDGTVTFMALDAINAKTNYVLDVNRGSTSPDANIIQYTYVEGNTNQRWYLVPYNQITMTFQSNEGSPVAPVVLGEEGLVQKPADPVRRGFSFAGWYKDEALTQAWDFSSDMLQESTTVYARWSALPETTVTYNSMGGSAVAPATEYIGQAAVKPADPVLSGYRFAGWYKDEALTDDWNFASDIVTGDMSLYAAWEESLTGRVIWLDSGHGLRYKLDNGTYAFDPGSTAAVSLYGGKAEWEYTYAYAKSLKPLLEAEGATVYIAYEQLKDQVFLPGGLDPNGEVRTGNQNSLDARGATAAALGADVFVSIHFNANVSTSPSGVVTDYYYPNTPTNIDYIPIIPFVDVNGNGWDAADYQASPKYTYSKALAYALQPPANPVGFGVFGIREPLTTDSNNDWRFLRNAPMPAVLMELGFLSNASDFAKIHNGGTPNPAIIQSIYTGIVDYFRSNPDHWDF